MVFCTLHTLAQAAVCKATLWACLHFSFVAHVAHGAVCKYLQLRCTWRACNESGPSSPIRNREQVHLVLNERAVDQRRNQPMATGRGMQLTRQIGEHLVAAELKDWAI